MGSAHTVVINGVHYVPMPTTLGGSVRPGLGAVAGHEAKRESGRKDRGAYRREVVHWVRVFPGRTAEQTYTSLGARVFDMMLDELRTSNICWGSDSKPWRLASRCRNGPLGEVEQDAAGAIVVPPHLHPRGTASSELDEPLVPDDVLLDAIATYIQNQDRSTTEHLRQWFCGPPWMEGVLSVLGREGQVYLDAAGGWHVPDETYMEGQRSRVVCFLQDQQDGASLGEIARRLNRSAAFTFELLSWLLREQVVWVTGEGSGLFKINKGVKG